jgi:hypothetical protein
MGGECVRGGGREGERLRDWRGGVNGSSRERETWRKKGEGVCFLLGMHKALRVV